MEWKTLGSRVLAKEYQLERKTESGIIIPETIGKDTSNVYEVTDVGEEVEGIEVGNVILVGDNTAMRVDSFTLNDEEKFIFNYGQIICVASLDI